MSLIDRGGSNLRVFRGLFRMIEWHGISNVSTLSSISL